jgi:hypothetical protein
MALSIKQKLRQGFLFQILQKKNHKKEPLLLLETEQKTTL